MIVLIVCIIVMPTTTVFASDDPVPMPGFNENDGGVLCGPISLALVIRMLGGEAAVLGLAAEIEMTHEGSSLDELQAAARSRGFIATGYTLESVEQVRLLTQDTPAIVQLRANHFGVIWSDNGNLQLSEFPNKLRTISEQALATQWNPTILLIRRPETPNPFDSMPQSRRPGRLSIIIACIVLLGAATISVSAWKKARNRSQ